MWFNLIKSVTQIGDSVNPQHWENLDIVSQKSHNMIMNAGANASLKGNYVIYTKQIDGVILQVTQNINYLFRTIPMIGKISLSYEDKELAICVECLEVMGTIGDNIASLFMVGKDLEIIDKGIKLIKKFNTTIHNKLQIDNGVYGLSNSVSFVNMNVDIIDNDFGFYAFDIVHDILENL